MTRKVHCLSSMFFCLLHVVLLITLEVQRDALRKREVTSGGGFWPLLKGAEHTLYMYVYNVCHTAGHLFSPMRFHWFGNYTDM